eukprot:CAMPEP_0114495962 /NCGR_PEP_ID=MMETSP0109-20121206/5512_1 /TAXON_ID=29199 /ORGANISM="Chlorarachnion reptans, Strain CCCM449" /LENGTH=229 /DNA_ID=CAMNT_0001673195 /DNA_START=504 /DNA_END=1190 /DNA_ORIENTATION=-
MKNSADGTDPNKAWASTIVHSSSVVSTSTTSISLVGIFSDQEIVRFMFFSKFVFCRGLSSLKVTFRKSSRNDTSCFTGPVGEYVDGLYDGTLVGCNVVGLSVLGDLVAVGPRVKGDAVGKHVLLVPVEFVMFPTWEHITVPLLCWFAENDESKFEVGDGEDDNNVDCHDGDEVRDGDQDGDVDDSSGVGDPEAFIGTEASGEIMMATTAVSMATALRSAAIGVGVLGAQ